MDAGLWAPKTVMDLLLLPSKKCTKRTSPPPQTHEAYEATRADALAVLFEALGLDSRLRHHRRALNAQEKGEVVRSVAGELQRPGGSFFFFF